MKIKTKKKIKTYSIVIGIPLAIGALSALLTKNSMDIYNDVTTPPLSPPGWLFPIVWSILYLMMGISSGIVWENRQRDPEYADRGLSYYAVSLAFNFAWSIVFFNLRWFLFAFLWLLALLYLIARTFICYKRISPLSAYLQIPYALWVAFAGYLNFAIWWLNR